MAFVLPFDWNHRFRCLPETHLRLVGDRDFRAELDERLGVLERVTLFEGTTYRIERRQSRVQLDRAVPTNLVALLGNRLQYIETWERPLGASQLRLRLTVLDVPHAVARAKLRADAVYDIRPSRKLGCTSARLHGQVRSDLPLVGPALERLLYGEMQRALHMAAETEARWLMRGTAEVTARVMPFAVALAG